MKELPAATNVTLFSDKHSESLMNKIFDLQFKGKKRKDLIKFKDMEENFTKRTPRAIRIMKQTQHDHFIVKSTQRSIRTFQGDSKMRKTITEGSFESRVQQMKIFKRSLADEKMHRVQERKKFHSASKMLRFIIEQKKVHDSIQEFRIQNLLILLLSIKMFDSLPELILSTRNRLLEVIKTKVISDKVCKRWRAFTGPINLVSKRELISFRVASKLILSIKSIHKIRFSAKILVGRFFVEIVKRSHYRGKFEQYMLEIKNIQYRLRRHLFVKREKVETLKVLFEKAAISLYQLELTAGNSSLHIMERVETIPIGFKNAVIKAYVEISMTDFIIERYRQIPKSESSKIGIVPIILRV